jgi:multidrug efflux system membrane fusion protein
MTVLMPSAGALRRASLFPLIALLLSACGPAPEPVMPPPEVSVAVVEPRQIRDEDLYVGRIEAVNLVEIRPRVAGHIAALHFEEGGRVRAGDLLVSLDDREYAAAAAAARAELERARSRVELAKSELARSEQLVAARAVSQGELEGRQAELRQAEADLGASRARLEQAELQLSFTRITSPIDGRVSIAEARVGSLVGAGEPLLTTVASVDPVRVVFDADERALLRYRANGEVAQTTLDVAVGGNGAGFSHAGQLDFVDNALAARTGTIRMRGTLPNPDGSLLPGLAARVRLAAGAPRSALLVHEQALLTDQDRKYVWVLASDANGQPIALRRDLVLGGSIDGLREVREGLAAGDRVVVNGVRKIFFPGQAVQPVDVPMEAPLQASQAAVAAQGG